MMRWKKALNIILILLLTLSFSSCAMVEIKSGVIDDQYTLAPWQRISEIIRETSPSVVMIEVYKDKDFQEEDSLGAGFFVEWPEGSGKIYLATAGHMTEANNGEGESIPEQGNFYYRATWKNIMMEKDELNSSNHCVFPIKLAFHVNSNEGDFAVFTFDKNDLTFNPKPLKWGDSTQLKPGDWVIAIGAPSGVYPHFTIGFVCHFNEPIDWGRGFYFYMVHSAFISPGNSGGPLLNLSGEVVGINLANIPGTSVSLVRTSAVMKGYFAQFLGSTGNESEENEYLSRVSDMKINSQNETIYYS